MNLAKIHDVIAAAPKRELGGIELTEDLEPVKSSIIDPLALITIVAALEEAYPPRQRRHRRQPGLGRAYQGVPGRPFMTLPDRKSALQPLGLHLLERLTAAPERVVAT